MVLRRQRKEQDYVLIGSSTEKPVWLTAEYEKLLASRGQLTFSLSYTTLVLLHEDMEELIRNRYPDNSS